MVVAVVKAEFDEEISRKWDYVRHMIDSGNQSDQIKVMTQKSDTAHEESFRST
jgi:hypothetical protein